MIDWNEFVVRMTPRLLGYVHLRSGSGLRVLASPEDIVQAIWERIWDKCGRESAELPTDARVFAFAQKVFLEFCRRSVRRVSGSDSQLESLLAEATTVCSRLARNEAIERFFARCHGWSEADQAVLRMVGIERMPQAEVGRRLGLSREAVAQRWLVIRRRLLEYGPPDGLFGSADAEA